MYTHTAHSMADAAAVSFAGVPPYAPDDLEHVPLIAAAGARAVGHYVTRAIVERQWDYAVALYEQWIAYGYPESDLLVPGNLSPADNKLLQTACVAQYGYVPITLPALALALADNRLDEALCLTAEPVQEIAYAQRTARCSALAAECCNILGYASHVPFTSADQLDEVGTALLHTYRPDRTVLHDTVATFDVPSDPQRRSLYYAFTDALHVQRDKLVTRQKLVANAAPSLPADTVQPRVTDVATVAAGPK